MRNKNKHSSADERQPSVGQLKLEIAKRDATIRKLKEKIITQQETMQSMAGYGHLLHRMVNHLEAGDKEQDTIVTLSQNPDGHTLQLYNRLFGHKKTLQITCKVPNCTLTSKASHYCIQCTFFYNLNFLSLSPYGCHMDCLEKHMNHFAKSIPVGSDESEDEEEEDAEGEVSGDVDLYDKEGTEKALEEAIVQLLGAN